MFNIRYTKLKFNLKLLQDSYLPVYKTSDIRGGIGQALLQNNCILNQDCFNCLFKQICIVENIMYSKYKILPKSVNVNDSVGYVLECFESKNYYNKDEILSFNIILFGDTIIYFNQIVQAIYFLGYMGLGKDRAKFTIETVQNSKGKNVIYCSEVFRENFLIETVEDYISERFKVKNFANEIIFKTPCTIKYRGNFIQEFDIEAIIKSIFRRIYILNCFEGNDISQFEIYQNYPNIVKQVVLKETITRYSTTHNYKLYLKGIKGEILLDNVNIELIPYFLAGELIHIGKNTSFGFGKYLYR